MLDHAEVSNHNADRNGRWQFVPPQGPAPFGGVVRDVWGAPRSHAPESVREVLIVGDSPAVCSALADALTNPRLRVVTTDSPARAFARLATDRIDFVIAESHLRLASGIDFLEVVRSEFPSVSRVLLTGDRDFASIREAIRRCNIAFLLPKPWDAGSLNELIERLLLADRSDVAPNDGLDAFPDPAVWGCPVEESNNDHLDSSAALRSSGSVEEE